MGVTVVERQEDSLDVTEQSRRFVRDSGDTSPRRQHHVQTRRA